MEALGKEKRTSLLIQVMGDKDRVMEYPFNNLFHNLSNTNFTEEEKMVMALGLKYKPQHEQANSEIKLVQQDINSYLNRVRDAKIKAYCGELSKQVHPFYSRITKYLYKLHYSNRNSTIVHKAIADNFGIAVEDYIRRTQQRVKKIIRNIRYQENSQQVADRKVVYEAIEQIKKRHDIVIKATDKNLGIASIRRDEYISAGYEKLNTNNYRKIAEYPQLQITKDYMAIFYDLGMITYKNTPINYNLPLDWSQFNIEEEYERIILLGGFYLSNPEFIRLCRFYLTLKVHKNPKGYREICASPSWITAILALIIHLLLLPILQKVPSYVRHSNDVIIDITEHQYPNQCVFIQADVESMYPSIKIKDGLRALNDILTKIQYNQRKMQLIMKGTEWVLRNNYMTFNQQTYLQMDGTAMGSSLSVTYACLYMAYKEQLAIDRFMHGGYQPILMYYRMVDDIAAIITDKIWALALMQSLIENVDEGIKFEYQINDDSMIFMDLEIYKCNEFTKTKKLSTRLYQKPMNKYLFLPYQSHHPIPVFKSWIICYLKRIRILCSEDAIYEYNKNNFKERLLRRGYPRKFLDKIFKIEYNRTQLIQQYKQRHQRRRKIKKSYKAALKIAYNGLTTKYSRQIRKCTEFTEDLKQDLHFEEIFGKRNSPMIIYKTTRNVSSLLISSELEPIQAEIKHNK
jgi:hypothetical protein